MARHRREVVTPASCFVTGAGTSWLLRWATDEEKAALLVACDEAEKRDRADYDAGRSLPASRV